MLPRGSDSQRRQLDRGKGTLNSTEAKWKKDSYMSGSDFGVGYPDTS